MPLQEDISKALSPSIYIGMRPHLFGYPENMPDEERKAVQVSPCALRWLCARVRARCVAKGVVRRRQDPRHTPAREWGEREQRVAPMASR